MLISTGYECLNLSHFIFTCVIAKLAHILNVTAAHMDMENFVFALCRLLTVKIQVFFVTNYFTKTGLHAQPHIGWSCGTMFSSTDFNTRCHNTTPNLARVHRRLLK